MNPWIMLRMVLLNCEPLDYVKNGKVKLWTPGLESLWNWFYIQEMVGKDFLGRYFLKRWCKIHLENEYYKKKVFLHL